MDAAAVARDPNWLPNRYDESLDLIHFVRLTREEHRSVTFITDAPARTVRVTVEGSRIGPSVLVADRDVGLCQLLDHVAVDPLGELVVTGVEVG